MQDDQFEWDDDKARRNLHEHKVSFELARSVFYDVNALIDADEDATEDRWHRIGMASNRVLFVVYTERVVDDHADVDRIRIRYRIISARKANNREQERYYRQTS